MRWLGLPWCGFFFFFQAEDGIRDLLVTGVQTCTLPILYVPAETSDSAPPAPESGVGPAAESVKSVGTALPPLSLVTVFTSFRCAAWSPFTIVHVFDCPSAIVPAQPAEALSCAYPAGPLSVASSEPSGVRG